MSRMHAKRLKGTALRNPASGLFETLRSGHAVSDRFCAGATIDTPHRGSQHASEWAQDEAAWLNEHRAVVHPLNHIVTDTHTSAEYILAISHDGVPIDLPLHLVAELEGDQISALRAYHSTYPLTGEYVCDRWGPADLPAQAGSAVYVRSASGLLDAVRIYDDVSPPAELFE